ncbi:cellular tumor antigen p53-like [Thrips palmi]|uniref:Cellular tumor antigen p53-like n=1 Tax=Thrips palmi TaxID=161013 RepID=A0A6P8ZLR8_THRPL|nr:cellular tumor antigen p53-like [Thrips palmi]
MSQESDFFGMGDMEHIQSSLGDASISNIMNNLDWASVIVPPDCPTGELPIRTDFPGPHFFDAKVDVLGDENKHFVVSSKLNKIFVNLEKVVPFQITWDGTPNLFVRALMVFTEPDQRKLPVRRCVTHRQQDDPTNLTYAHREHVLAMDNVGAVYSVDPSSCRHSVTVPLYLQPGCEYNPINLKFMCMTSCTGGLNRSPTDVIFTLENEYGAVLGRKVIGVKICSCPKRDARKEEQNCGETSTGKRKMKVKREEKTHSAVEGQPMKRVKQELNEFPSSMNLRLTVDCINPEVFSELKEHLAKWNSVKMWEYAAPGVTPTPIIEVNDETAVLPPPDD